jgi:hypothetical protein
MASWAARLKASAPAPEPAPSVDVPQVTAQNGSEHPAEQSLAGRKVVLDSGAIIKGGRLERLGDNFWTVNPILLSLSPPDCVLFVTQPASRPLSQAHAMNCFM